MQILEIMIEELNFIEMSEVMGGVSAKKYCKLLLRIIINNDLDDGAKEGAAYGWSHAGCGRFYSGVVM